MPAQDRARRVVAVIDVGSNSVRLLVARELSREAFEVVDEERYDAHIGQGLIDGELSPGAVERGVAALRVMAQVAASHRPSRIVAVGTEALRRAHNTGRFLDLAESQTGLRVRVLSGEEEAAASFLGVINSTALQDGLALDIGGGSFELFSFRDRKLGRAQSAPLGALFALERYLTSDPPTNKEVRALRKAVRAAFEFGPPIETVLGVGGAVRNLARMARVRRRYPIRRLHGLELTRKEVRLLARDLAAVPEEARRRIPGVGAARAATIHAAAIAIDEALDAAGAQTLLVSGQGLREGLAWQELRPRSPVLPDVRAASITGLALANRVEMAAAEPLAAHALVLFDATRAVHGLGDDARALLDAAARLARIGMHIDYYQRDRHAEYLVHSGDLHGFTHREIVLLGAAVRWAASGTPDLSSYAPIPAPGDARTAALLASFLGVAMAVHRRPLTPVRGFEAACDEMGLVLRLVSDEDVAAEVNALGRQQKRLEGLLGLPVAISARAPAEGSERPPR